jgi:CheY-like chemotaxis protein
MISLLIADDNQRTRQMIKTVVADFASEIYECGDGAEVIAIYAAHQPDWVLMDIQMPEPGGLEATRQIKALWPDAHILIVTSYDDDETREAASGAGAIGLVGKENLLAIRQFLQQTPPLAQDGLPT